MADVASLEWTEHTLLEHEFAPELSLQAGVPAGVDPLKLSFIWHPAAELFWAASNVDRLRTGKATEPDWRQIHLLLRARHGKIQQLELEPEVFGFYSALRWGKSLGEAVAGIGNGNFDIITSLSQALAFGCFAEIQI